ncbi:MAG: hypothetical protein IT431_10840 [Phycisphaerales bacterium]|nr:hypothetical protein [Phycisphaerales bacterium]
MSAGDPRTKLAPICPRCGYDQSGIVATWEDRCPVRGRCSECGLEFWWWQAMAERVLGPAWSVEHGERLSPRRWARAYWAGLWQWGLWERFDLVARTRARRLAAFAVATLLLNHLLLVVLVGAARTAAMSYMLARFTPQIGVGGWLAPYAQWIEIPLTRTASLSAELWPVSFLVAMSWLAPTLLMFVFTQTMSRVGVRRVHIWRGAAYMLPATGPGIVLCGAATAGVMLGQEVLPAVAEIVWGVLMIGTLLGWIVGQALRWRSFVKHHLGLPHAGWIALSMVIVTGLAFVSLGLTISLMGY